MSNSAESDGAKANDDAKAGRENRSRFSLHRLSAAFAHLTGTTSSEVPAEAEDSQQMVDEPRHDPIVSSPRLIVEAMLFVGHPDGRPMSGRELAAPIRDVSPTEIDAIVAELNQDYDQSQTCYRIVSHGGSYLLQLKPELEHFRQTFGGRMKHAKLTSQAVEVLSIVAYKQPITSEQVANLRGRRSEAHLNQLVRRELLSLERTTGAASQPVYRTTDRFNRLFGLKTVGDLPNSEDLDDK